MSKNQIKLMIEVADEKMCRECPNFSPTHETVLDAETSKPKIFYYCRFLDLCEYVIESVRGTSDESSSKKDKDTLSPEIKYTRRKPF